MMRLSMVCAVGTRNARGKELSSFETLALGRIRVPSGDVCQWSAVISRVVLNRSSILNFF